MELITGETEPLINKDSLSEKNTTEETIVEGQVCTMEDGCISCSG